MTTRFYTQAKVWWPERPGKPNWHDTCEGHDTLLDAIGCADGVAKRIAESLSSSTEVIFVNDIGEALSRISHMAHWQELKRHGGKVWIRTIKRTWSDEIMEEERQLV